MTEKDTREMQAALAKPFAPEDLEWRLQNTIEESMRGMAVPYDIVTPPLKILISPSASSSEDAAKAVVESILKSMMTAKNADMKRFFIGLPP